MRKSLEINFLFKNLFRLAKKKDLWMTFVDLEEALGGGGLVDTEKS